MKKLEILKVALLAILAMAFAWTGCNNDDDIDVPPVEDLVLVDDGSGIGTRTLESGKEYVLNGFVFVNDGQVLTIEPGAVVKGRAGAGANASALIVARGGTILAEGTAENPIIFTAEQDDLSDPNDIAPNTTGLWGGLIILGNAPLNSDPGETAIEGIPTNEVRGIYGGSNPTDNSGILKYVSIRYGGTDIGAGNEINGLTLGGVGSGTEIDYVEVIFNADDGVEFFGGVPNTKHLAVAFVGDDSYDYDEGYDGLGQFWFTVQNDAVGSDRAGEHDGGTSPETGMPFATPEVWNATYIGRGAAAGRRVITFRDNAGGEYHCSIFTEQERGIDVEILGNGDDSYKQFEDGLLKLENNAFWNVAGNTADDIFAVSPAKYGVRDDMGNIDPVKEADSTAEVDAAKAAFQAYFATGNNSVEEPGIAVSYTAGDQGLNPVPTNTLGCPTTPSDPFFTNTNYKGAFEPNGENWMSGWTLLDELEYFTN